MIRATCALAFADNEAIMRGIVHVKGTSEYNVIISVCANVRVCVCLCLSERFLYILLRQAARKLNVSR